MYFRKKMNNKNDDWTIENLDYDIEVFLRYSSLPIGKKLQYLDEANEFFYKLTPKANRLAWQKLKEEGW